MDGRFCVRLGSLSKIVDRKIIKRLSKVAVACTMIVSVRLISFFSLVVIFKYVGFFVDGFTSMSTVVKTASCRNLSHKISKTFLSSTAAEPGPSQTSSIVELTVLDDKKPSADWELDCYSRPVVGPGGKKLWEVLVTDSTGSFRFCKTLPSNQVNSKELRKTVEELLDDVSLPVKPTTIRFFRGAMFNMINIALSDLDVVGRPSRCTYAIAQWLEERHREVYPNMDG
jgi:hypothetical protein